MAVARLGLPAAENVAGQYRLHADRIADGEVPRPRMAVLVEVGPDGISRVYTFGGELPARTKCALLLDAAQHFNAEAGN